MRAPEDLVDRGKVEQYKVLHSTSIQAEHDVGDMLRPDLREHVRNPVVVSAPVVAVAPVRVLENVA